MSKQPLIDKPREDVNAKKQVLAQIAIDWNGAAAGLPVRYSNQAMVQIHERDLLLSFFMTAPPLVIGTPEEVQEQLLEIDKIRPECLARISMNRHTLHSLIKIIQAKLTELEDAENESGAEV